MDTSERRVVSLNEASSGMTSQSVSELGGDTSAPPKPKPHWPKENKPTVADVLTCITLLTAVGQFLSEPLYTAADDFRNFFNQLRLAPEEFWKCGMVLSSDGHAKFVSEYIMTFGLRPASNIAQRFAEAIVAMWRDQMQEAELPYLQQAMDRSADFARWVASRGGIHSAAAQLFAVFIYTDDPIFIILGAERMARGLRIWNSVCSRVGLLMAIPEKRQCGTWVEWLGAGISSVLAVAWITPHKLLSALTKIASALACTLTIAEYHSLLGLLEHLVFLNRMKRSIMYSLWEPFQQKVALEPNRLLSPSAAMVKRLHQWQSLLSSNAGVAAIRMVSLLPASPATLTLTIYSDAMRDPGVAGLGGFFHGLYWSHVPPPVYARIPIAVLEFIAALTSIMTFAYAIPPLEDVAHTLHVRVDALSTPFILTEDAASSPAMIALHSFILDLPQFQMISPYLLVSHVPGVGNELSDAASRSDFPRLHRLCHNLRVSPSVVDPHCVCSELLNLALPFY